MLSNQARHVFLGAIVVFALGGICLHQWGRANDSTPPPPAAAALREQEPAKAPPARPSIGRRREAVIRPPVGTFVKEVEVTPYGSGRLTWTYEDERVLGLIEASVMGVDFELATEAEYSLSTNGTIYGIVTGVQLNRLKLPAVEPYAQLRPYVGLWTAAEPLVNEVVTDLPFSYQFRIQGERLTISNYRILLAGPNPFGKLGGFLGGSNGDKLFAIVAYFQAIGTAIEGTYTAEAKDKPPRGKAPRVLKSRT